MLGKGEEQTYAGVKLTLERLTNMELAAFGICLGSSDQREVCQDESWFPEVEHLFTGSRVHGTVLNAICRIIEERTVSQVQV